MRARWSPGELIVRNEVLGLDPVPRGGWRADWYGKQWFRLPVFVVEDSHEQLVTYIAPGAEFGFPEGQWPTVDGRHPWHGRTGWGGHGCLTVQRPGDHHAVWHFWTGPDRTFSCWYINLQTAFRRTGEGYDTQDLELDIVVDPDGAWQLKDFDVLPDRVREGRYTASLVEWVIDLGEQLTDELEAGRQWWDPSWAEWTPDPAWVNPRLPR